MTKDNPTYKREMPNAQDSSYFDEIVLKSMGFAIFSL